VKMTPEATVPHPELHTRADLLIPAAECWESCIHPIFNKSLHSLAKKFSQQGWGECYAQGRSILG